MFGCNNDRHFPEKYTMKDHRSNTKPEKGYQYYIQTRHKDLFSLQKEEAELNDVHDKDRDLKERFHFHKTDFEE